MSQELFKYIRLCSDSEICDSISSSQQPYVVGIITSNFRGENGAHRILQVQLLVLVK